MEQVRNEQTIYSAAVYCRLSKDDDQAGESVSIETQKMNILTRKTYSLSTGTLLSTDSWGYGDSTFGDRLTAYNGETVSYDAYGRVSQYRGEHVGYYWDTNFERIYNIGSVYFTYHEDGMRRTKSVGNLTHSYTYDGINLVREEWGDNTLIFLYDASGSPVGMQYRNSSYASGAWDVYFYEKNLQGDIVSVYTEDRTLLVSYTYDAWGSFTATYHNGGALTSAAYNPFTYRGYYYDTETGLYYVSSRYYDPEIGRWINADNRISGVGGSILGYNMFAYCMNNPVNMSDPTGSWPKWIETAANWVNNNIIQPVASFIEKSIDYPTPPSKEDHYNRNQNNIQFPEEYDETFFKDWDDSVSANCHQFSAPNRDNVKYVSPDGKYEAIYDVKNKLVTDPRDVGTYNFISPNENPFGHFIKDVIPWIQHGNSPNDSTEWWQRALSFIAIYV